MTIRLERHGPWLLGLGWLAAIAVVDPRGEFPLNDDWAYAHPVRQLLETGFPELSGWTVPTLVAQVAWGALFCLPAGFSFEALRAAGLVAGGLGVLATDRLLREAGASPGRAFAGAALLAANPLYFNLSHTFMTDVPFTAASVGAAWLGLRWLRTGRDPALLGFVAATAVALLVRQLALALPLAAALVALRDRATRRWAGLPVLAAVAVLLAHAAWVRTTQPVTGMQDLPVREALALWQRDAPAYAALVLGRVASVSLYLGLCAAPALLLVPRARPWRRPDLGVATAAGALLAAALATGGLLPRLPNVWFDLGLGPATLRDHYLLGRPSWPSAGAGTWAVLTAIAWAGGVALAARASAALAGLRARDPVDATRQRTGALALATLGLYVPVIAAVSLGDRYLLFALPFVLLVVVATGTRPIARPGLRTVAAVALLLASAGFAVAGTHDYLAWNRARWAALERLEREGIGAERIDGGFEYNGLRRYRYPFRPRPGRSWWWVDDDEYVVAFGPLPGYDERFALPFRRWLPPGEGKVAVLQRRDPTGDPGRPPAR